MLILTCECGQRMKVPPKLLGKASKCVRCGATITISEENTRPLEEPPSDAAEPPKKEQEATGPTNASCDLIGELLIENGLVTEEQVQEALARQKQSGGRICENLIDLEHLDKTALHDFLSKQSGVASMALKNYNIPPDLAELVPYDFARERQLIPIDKLGRLLTVGMAFPLDAATVTDLEQRSGLKVKPMLCQWDDVLATIERYYPEARMQEPATFELPFSKPKKAESAAPAQEADVAKQLAQLDSLPVLPETVLRVREAVDRDGCTIRDLLGIVEAAPGVAAKLLSVANTSIYGMPGQVEGLALAATLLGIDGVCDTVVASEIEGASHNLKHFDLAAFGVDSVFCAKAATALAEACEKDSVPAAHAAGLLHAIGRLALAQAAPEQYGALPEGLVGDELLQEEQRLTGTSSPEAGYALAKAWVLPDGIADAIRSHRRPVEANGRPLTAIVRLACAMADAHARGAGAGAGTFPKDALDALGLDDSAAARIFGETAAQMA